MAKDMVGCGPPNVFVRVFRGGFGGFYCLIGGFFLESIRLVDCFFCEANLIV